MKKESYIMSKKYAIYAKKDLVLMMTIKNIKSEIIVITLENKEKLLMLVPI